MNFFNNFTDQWNSRFPDSSQPPQMDCLKADHFCTLLDQKHAIEVEESKICAVLEELKRRLARESFVADFLHKCIQKLGAVSQVFNEIDQCDSKSSSSSGTTGIQSGSAHSPGPSINGTGLTANNKGAPQNGGSPFHLFPQCIASSLIHSASPLLAAAAATSNAPFLLPSSLSHFPCPDAIKLDPESDSLNAVSSSFLFSATERQPYANLSHLTSPSPLYNGTNSTSNHHTSGSNGNPFNSAVSQLNHSVHSSLRVPTPFCRGNDACRLPEDSPTSEAQVAAAVAAAFGLGLSSARSVGVGHSFQQSGSTINFARHDNLLSPSSSTSAGVSGTGTQIATVGHSTSGTVSHPIIEDRTVAQALETTSTTERPYRCGTCSRSFAVKAGLVQHMRTHTDERPYPCLHCGRAFKQKIQLTTHMRVHSGERPYGCRLCGKLFRQQSHVVQHLRTHTGEKPHKCYQCGKAFRQKYSLISHQRRMCRNRAASNPIAAGMTMWISPGVGGDTCNLVKEFSPTKCHLNPTVSTNSISTGVVSNSIATSTSVHSPFSPFLSSPSVSTTTVTNTTPIAAPFHTLPVHEAQSSHPDDDRYSNAARRKTRDLATSHRHHPATPESNPDAHLSHLCDDRESQEIEEPICSPRATQMSAPTALGLS